MPLKVIIVGAGIAGLGTAFALNRAGHDVQVFEQSGLLSEVGAAIHVAPNASRILKDWGCDFKKLWPVYCKHLSVYGSDGSFMGTPAVTTKLQAQVDTEDEWLLVHRVDLHNSLRSLAEKEIDGRKAKIHLSTKVVSVNESTGELTLEDGTVHQADLIIGADGIHSRTVAGVIGQPPERKSTGQNCFRFLVPTEKLKSKPKVKAFMDKVGYDGLNAFVSRDRRLVVYPCRGGTLLNIVGFHPSEPHTTNISNESSWLSSGQYEDLMRTYKEFCPELREFCSLAEDLKLWSLASRDPPPTFSRGKLVLIGDAAHPTLPHQGQGGAQALEDGAALAALLPSDTSPNQIPERLKFFNQVRYARAVTVMLMSKVNDERRGEMMEELRTYVPSAELPGDMWTYAWASYPDRDARHLLETAVHAQ